MEIHDVVILGAGPAGYTAAIYTGRAGLKTVLIEGHQPGGQLMITTSVENYPGFPNGIEGPRLMSEMRAQAERFGVKITAGVIEKEKVDLSKRPFKVAVDSSVYQSKVVIVATGASARWLGLESEQKLRGKGVSACATCDGFFFKGQVVVVIGGGDTAIEEALFLTRFAREVYVVHRRDKLRAGEYLQKQAFRSEKIRFIWNSVPVEILGVPEGKVTGVRLKDVKSGETKDFSCDGVFVAIGHIPNTEPFTGTLDMDENGYIKTVPGRTATNIPGVFAAGDVADPYYRQAITAAGSGCMAAIEAERFLASLGGNA